jgi:hypothetical protein
MISCVIKMNQINVKNIVKIIINGSVFYVLIKFFVFSMRYRAGIQRHFIQEFICDTDTFYN